MSRHWEKEHPNILCTTIDVYNIDGNDEQILEHSFDSGNPQNSQNDEMIASQKESNGKSITNTQTQEVTTCEIAESAETQPISDESNQNQSGCGAGQIKTEGENQVGIRLKMLTHSTFE